MAPPRIKPEARTCPVCSTIFEVGGRGRRPRSTVCCSLHCAQVRGHWTRTVYNGSHAPRPKKNRDTVHNEAWLRARYLDDRMTMEQIAKLTNCATPSIASALRKFGIPSRTAAESMPRKVRPRGPIRGGLSLAEYQVLHDAQAGLCAACGKPERATHRNGTVLRLAVDHDHATNQVRALLCSRCNYSLGYARDDVAMLAKLIAYLEFHA